MNLAMKFIASAGDRRSLGGVVEDALAAFLLQRSQNTQRSYTQILDEWAEFLSTHGTSIDAATTLLAYWFLTAQRERIGFRGEKVSAATVQRKAVVLNAAYKFLIAVGASKTNPFEASVKESRKPRSGDRRPTKALSDEQVHSLIQSPSVHTKEGQRDRAFLGTLFGGRLRISEALALNLSDVERSSAGTTVKLATTKAGNTARQPLPSWVSDRLLLLEIQRRADGAKNNSPLFVGYFNSGKIDRRLTASTGFRLFKKLCANVGIHGFSPHSARATAITKLLSEDVPHRDVQEFSRHSSILMVEKYDKRRIKIGETVAKKLKW